jgi:hypothetical protein
MDEENEKINKLEDMGNVSAVAELKKKKLEAEKRAQKSKDMALKHKKPVKVYSRTLTKTKPAVNLGKGGLADELMKELNAIGEVPAET